MYKGNRFAYFCQVRFLKPREVGTAAKNDTSIMQYVNYTRFCIICQIKMQKLVFSYKGNRFSHFCQVRFLKPREVGTAAKNDTSIMQYVNYTRFCIICQIKMQEKRENLPIF